MSLKNVRRQETRGDCPICGYHNAYVETTCRSGRRIGWCASCQDREAIASYLQGEVAPERRVGTTIAADDQAKRAKAQERARVIWNGAAPVTPHDPAGKYFIRRVLAYLIGNQAIRYRPDVPHPAGGGRYPAMLALVQDVAGDLVGVHRTYLAPDGTKARVEPVKASKGPIWGGAIRLGSIAPEIVIGEGIETSTSAGLLLGLPAWAAISAGNLASGLVLPPEVRSVVIAADDDGVNAQGRNPGLEAAEAAWWRWRAEGRAVRIIKPDQPGQDFNDILQARAAEVVA